MKGKVVIFGGAGFIGSYLTEELLKREYSVIVADIKQNQYTEKAEFVYCDITSPEQIAQAIPENTDYIYNFAGFANLERSVKHPVDTVRLNIMGNLYILDELRRRNIKRYVFASSAYALNDKGSFYGVSKLASEKLVEEFYRQYGIKYTILRYGSVYSERDFDNNYIYSPIKTIINEHKVVHTGDGNEIREYIHASDVASMAADVIASEEYANQYMILTGVERMKRKELFEMIREILGEDFEVILQNSGYVNHYRITPYSFQPTMSRKMVANTYVDMGQGILECIKQVYKEKENDK